MVQRKVQELGHSLFINIMREASDELGIEKGDRLEQTVTEDGALVIRPTQNNDGDDE